MIWHQAISPDIHLIFSAPLTHQIELGPVVVVAEKGLLTAVAALGDMMGVSRCYDACDSGHGWKVGELG